MRALRANGIEPVPSVDLEVALFLWDNDSSKKRDYTFLFSESLCSYGVKGIYQAGGVLLHYSKCMIQSG